MFFKILLHVFYSSIIIENEEFIPSDGNPAIICANHSNSVMDAVVLVTSVSRKVLLATYGLKRNGKCLGVLRKIQLSTEKALQVG